MFFAKEQVIDNLKCPKCKETFVDPRTTPCCETICISCIDELTNKNNEIVCFFCNQIHKIPVETGFKQNDYLNKILTIKPCVIYRGETFAKFESNLDKLTQITDELELTVKNPQSAITEHCAQVRNQIDLCAEERINEINTIRFEYIAKINEYEKQLLASNLNENLKNLGDKHQVFDTSINKSKECIQDCTEYLKSDTIVHESLKRKISQTEEVYDHVHKKLTSLRSVVFNRRLLFFKPNKLLSETKKDFGSFDNKLLINYQNTNFNGELYRVLNVNSEKFFEIELLSGDKIISSSLQSGIQIWNIESGECIKTISVKEKKTVSYLKRLDNNTFAAGFSNGLINIYDSESGLLIKSLHMHDNRINFILNLNNGNLASSSNDESTIKIWNQDTCELVAELRGHSQPVTCMVLINNDTIASSSTNDYLNIWNIEKVEIVRRIKVYASSFILLKNGNFATCCGNNTIRILHFETGAVLKMLSGHTSPINNVVEFKNGNIASASNDRTIRIWNPNTGDELKKIEAHTDAVHSLKLFDYDYLVSASFDKTIKIFN